MIINLVGVDILANLFELWVVLIAMEGGSSPLNQCT